MADSPDDSLTYASAGVDLDARRRVVERYRDAAKGASRPEVLSGVGPFAGLFALGQRFRDPVIVSSTDGVGTKTKLASLTGRYESLGWDIVANCVNDAFTTGAEPLFFLDYIASSDLPADAKVQLVKGVADACAAIGCALLGGETADMPGVYPSGEFDLVGFIVGGVERDQLIDGSRVQPGDLLFALPSNGLHTNGYSLAREALQVAVDPSRANDDRRRLERYEESLGETLADALLKPHICYVNQLKPALSLTKAIAHVTGGGIEENLPRVLPDGVGARIQRGAWTIPPVFDLIQREGRIAADEMYRVFNMGVGVIVAVAPSDADELVRLVPEAVRIGETTASPGVTLA